MVGQTGTALSGGCVPTGKVLDSGVLASYLDGRLAVVFWLAIAPEIGLVFYLPDLPPLYLKNPMPRSVPRLAPIPTITTAATPHSPTSPHRPRTQPPGTEHLERADSWAGCQSARPRISSLIVVSTTGSTRVRASSGTVQRPLWKISAMSLRARTGSAIRATDSSACTCWFGSVMDRARCSARSTSPRRPLS